MRDDYVQAARAVVQDPYVLVNLVSRRVKQLRAGARPLVESLEKLKLEDIALREVAEGKISYELYEAPEEVAPTSAVPRGSAGRLASSRA
jgi:DNA-directed RNA polymerase subunit omega